jgi:tight adherence protein C
MNTSWLIDLILLLVLAFVAVMALQLNRHKSWIDDEDLETIPRDTRKSGFSLYPFQLIRHAGFVPDNVKWIYWAGKILLALLLPVTLLEFNLNLSVASFVASGLLGFFGPDIWLWQHMRKRQARIEYALSYFLDLTIAFLVSGMSLDTAIRQGVKYGLPPRNPLRQELGLVFREIDAGRDRNDAFTALLERTGVSDLQSVVNMIRVGFQLGSPIVTSLQSHSDMLRSRLQEKGLKRINLKTVMAMVPLVLLNFPMMGLLVFFPAVVELSRLLPMLEF